MINKCKVCGEYFKTDNVELKVYPKDYDFDCCRECNENIIKS